ncbi:MAG: N-acetylmuramoyl-L-alanine amidase [Bacteroidales bacterium]|nr:N-acetylmuramoyl-L-alanine amidase [Bacteroidales bacterium]
MAFALAFAGHGAAAQEQQGPVLKTICIDAGHGGKDSGCISRDGKKIKEKDITLAIALKVRDLVNQSYPSVKVVMTRDKDSYPTLQERALKANKANADLFISIHVNSVDPKKNKNWAGVSGFSVHTLGQSRTGRDLFSSNMELCKRENSVILLEDDYSTRYQGFEPGNPESYIIFNLMQNNNLLQSLSFAEDLDQSLRTGPIKKSRGISQDPFLVLWMTTMPSVLLECGFITNTADLQAMSTESGQKKIAGRIFDAFKAFKTRYDGVDSAQAGPQVEDPEEQEEAAAPVPEADCLYGTQVMASSKRIDSNDKMFKGYTAVSIRAGNLYKYIIGVDASLEQARKENEKIKKIFPNSFMVKVENGATEILR